MEQWSLSLGKEGGMERSCGGITPASPLVQQSDDRSDCSMRYFKISRRAPDSQHIKRLMFEEVDMLITLI